MQHTHATMAKRGETSLIDDHDTTLTCTLMRHQFFACLAVWPPGTNEPQRRPRIPGKGSDMILTLGLGCSRAHHGA
jgi:hypothetical protein